VAAARALIGHPNLVIADEPTSALDEDRRGAFMRLLMAQCAQADSALLFVTHDARLAEYFDEVVDLPQVNRAATALPASDSPHHSAGSLAHAMCPEDRAPRSH
jgi:putative ABC transport system ATP-binding protein